MNEAVGPFSTSPPTIGLTAITGASAASSASWIPGTARIGAIETSGFDGPITITRAAAIAASTAALGGACSAPRNSTSSTRPAPRSRIMKSWDECHPVPVRIHVRTHADRLVQTLERGRRRVPAGEQPRALQAPCEVAVAEAEPHLYAQALQ